jgi:hypothetical protein
MRRRFPHQSHCDLGSWQSWPVINRSISIACLGGFLWSRCPFFAWSPIWSWVCMRTGFVHQQEEEQARISYKHIVACSPIWSSGFVRVSYISRRSSKPEYHTYWSHGWALVQDRCPWQLKPVEPDHTELSIYKKWINSHFCQALLPSKPMALKRKWASMQ